MGGSGGVKSDGYTRLYVPQARLAQSVERETLNLNVVGSSPTLGGNLFFSMFLPSLSRSFLTVQAEKSQLTSPLLG